MKFKILALIVYCLRWLAWAVRYLVIWPAGTLVLIIALVFCLDKTTPGMVVVNYLQEAGNITDGQRWTWRECPKQVPAGLPASSELPEGIGRFQADACPEVVSDARGYAAYVDRTLLRTLILLWVLIGLNYAGLSWLLGFRPFFPHKDFVSEENGKGNIRCALSRPGRGKGRATVSPGQKESEKFHKCEVSSLAADKNTECPENESEK